ncbi:MAG: hypothetical protein WA021_04100 [Minisyncoccia bacterium]
MRAFLSKKILIALLGAIILTAAPVEVIFNTPTYLSVVRINFVEAANCTETSNNGINLIPSPSGRTRGGQPICLGSDNREYYYTGPNGTLVDDSGRAFGQGEAGLGRPDLALLGLDGDGSCSGTGFWSNWSRCVGRTIAVWISTIAIWITGWFLGASAVLFNWVMENTVVNFNGYVYAKVATGIQAVWGAFRDIANIIIIGIFTFVALELILGTSTFGGKKMIAKILIIAILINFSLLFSRIIIESANFVSGQFYRAVLFQSAPAGGFTSISAADQIQLTSGISGRFAQLMGVGSWSETKDALQRISDDPNGGGPTAFTLGILSAMIFLATAAVFFYGSFLMITRAILLVFLIMTSSLAFASYLLPDKIVKNYGWTEWWSSLLKAAVFGPLLLIFLWATLIIGENIKAESGNSIGGLLANPASTGSIAALFSYLMILGMLFASIKIASSFANKIGGFNYAAVMPAMGFGIAGRIIGATGRQTAGRVFSGAAGAAQAGSKSERLPMGMRKALDFTSQQLKKGAKADYNPLKASVAGIGLGAEMQKIAGFKKLDAFAGKDIGGFEGSLKKRAEAIAEQAERMTPKLSKDQKEQIEKKAHDEALAGKEGLAASGAKQRSDESNAALRELLKQQRDTTKTFESKMDQLTKELGKAEATAIAAGRNPKEDARARDLKASIERERSQDKSEMQSQQERINHARSEVDKAREAHKESQTSLAKAIAKNTEAKTPSAQKTGEALAARDPLLRKELAEKVKKHLGDKKEKDLWRKQLAALKAVEAAAPAAPPPADH